MSNTQDLDIEDVSSNDALSIRVGSSVTHPTYTYPIYGDQELIQGYVEPKIELEFHPRSMRPLLSVSFKSKQDSAQDIAEQILEYLPKDTATDRDRWKADQKAQSDNTFTIPGKRVSTFGDYSIYKTGITSDEAQSFLKRIQILVLLLIEAGSYIDGEDDRWELYLLIKHETSEFVGFATVYPYFYYDSGRGFEINSSDSATTHFRKRISQFLILPSFQRRGLGRQFYNALFKLFLKDPRVVEVTVEDPNEAFDDIRDRGDVERLEKEGLDIDLPLEEKEILSLMEKTKIIRQQLQRCLEMILLRANPDEPKEFRQLVKERLWQRNYENLTDLDPSEQRKAINDAYKKVLQGYRQLLGLAANDSEPEEEEEEEEGIPLEELAGPARKRARQG